MLSPPTATRPTLSAPRARSEKLSRPWFPPDPSSPNLLFASPARADRLLALPNAVAG